LAVLIRIIFVDSVADSLQRKGGNSQREQNLLTCTFAGDLALPLIFQNSAKCDGEKQCRGNAPAQNGRKPCPSNGRWRHSMDGRFQRPGDDAVRKALGGGERTESGSQFLFQNVFPIEFLSEVNHA
jgi:hypothetical protein